MLHHGYIGAPSLMASPSRWLLDPTSFKVTKVGRTVFSCLSCMFNWKPVSYRKYCVLWLSVWLLMCPRMWNVPLSIWLFVFFLKSAFLSLAKVSQCSSSQLLISLLNKPSALWLQSVENGLFVTIQWVSSERERHSTASLRAQDSLHTRTNKSTERTPQSSLPSQGRDRVGDRLRWIRIVSVGHASTFLHVQEATVRAVISNDGYVRVTFITVLFEPKKLF